MTSIKANRDLPSEEPATENNNQLDIDYYNIKKAAMILRALNHKLRQDLIKTIHDKKRITVTQLFVQLRIEQSVASQHLALLRKAGIVSTKREGKFIFYAINSSRIETINKLVRNF